jgi:hypothetical protein
VLEPGEQVPLGNIDHRDIGEKVPVPRPNSTRRDAEHEMLYQDRALLWSLDQPIGDMPKLSTRDLIEDNLFRRRGRDTLQSLHHTLASGLCSNAVDDRSEHTSTQVG